MKNCPGVAEGSANGSEAQGGGWAHLRRDREGEEKGTSSSLLALHPDVPSIMRNDLPANGESKSRSVRLVGKGIRRNLLELVEDRSKILISNQLQ